MDNNFKRSAHGFTVVELLIALAVTMLILTAAAVAFNACAISYGENEKIFSAVNSGRLALSQVTSNLRTAQAVDPNSTASACSLITAAGDDITYSYNSANDILYLVTNDDANDIDHPVCENISDMTFTYNTAVEGSVIYVRSVQISMTVNTGGFEKEFSCGVVIRTNLD